MCMYESVCVHVHVCVCVVDMHTLCVCVVFAYITKHLQEHGYVLRISFIVSSGLFFLQNRMVKCSVSFLVISADTSQGHRPCSDHY